MINMKEIRFMNKNIQMIINYKKLFKTILFVLIGILIKSVFQYIFGAEEMSIQKLIFGLDFPFYWGCIFGGWFMVLLQDNYYTFMSKYLPKSFILNLDSGDESEDKAGLKKSWKGKNKITDSDNNNTTSGSSTQVNLEGVELSLSQRAINKYINKVASMDMQRVNFESVDKLTLDERVLSSMVAKELSKDTKLAAKVLMDIGKQVEDSRIIDLSKIDINDKLAANKFVIGFLDRHARLYSNHLNIRFQWLECRLVNMAIEDRQKVAEHLIKIDDFNKKFLSSIIKIQSHSNPSTQAKVFFSLFNEQRKLINRELLQAEDITIKHLKRGPFCLVNDPDCKEFISSLKEYNKAKEKFSSHDNYLKKKIGEMVNK